MRRLSILKQPLLATVNDHLIDYPSPSNLSYWWSFGSLAGICLIVQIATGIFLAMHYTPHVDLAFLSVEHIMRDVNGGWFLRYMHANGASMFFIVVYLHLFRGLYYGSYASPRELVWIVGVVILLNDSYSFYWLCITLGSNVFLGSYCYYITSFSYSSCWYGCYILALGWF